MLWCLLTPAAICLLLALLTLSVRASGLRRLRPVPAIRGCLALMLVLIALLLGVLALALSQGAPGMAGG